MRYLLTIMLTIVMTEVPAQEWGPVMETVAASRLGGEVSATDSAAWHGAGHVAKLHLRTNLLYDAALVPSVGVEFPVGDRLTVAVSGAFNWLGSDSRHRYWRIALADAELRRWLGSRQDALLLKGHHVGVYVTACRYDLEFGGRGWMGDFNCGGGISYGYSAPIGRTWSLDFTVGVGYLGGRYKEYEPSRDTWNHYVWQADRTLNWFGPTKAEVTLVWHLGGGSRQKAQTGNNRRKGGTAWW